MIEWGIFIFSYNNYGVNDNNNNNNNNLKILNYYVLLFVINIVNINFGYEINYGIKRLRSLKKFLPNIAIINYILIITIAILILFFTYSLVFAQDVPFSMAIKINAFILVSLTLLGSFYLITVYCIYVYYCYIDIYKLKIECNIFSLLSSKELLIPNKIFSLALNTYWINIASYLVLVTYHGMVIYGYPNIILYITERKDDDKSLASIWVLYIGILIIGYFLFSFCPSKIIINKASHVKALMIRKLCKKRPIYPNCNHCKICL